MEIFIEHNNVPIKGNKLKKIILFLGIILIGSIIFSGAVSAKIIHVNPASGLQKSIKTAHSGDTLVLSTGTYREHYITVNKNLNIIGPTITGNLPKAVVDAQKKGRVFNIPNGVKVTLQNLLIQNGGYGVYNRGKINIKTCTIRKNKADQGAGICNFGTVVLTNSNVCYNTAYNNYLAGGGGILNYGGICTVVNSKIYKNTAPVDSDGGGITNGGTFTLKNSKVYSNTASDGGGIWNDFGTFNVINSYICYNTANSGGGGISNDYGTITLTNSKVYKNIASSGGGGIYNGELGIVKLITSSVFYNTVTSSYGEGGGIYNSAGKITLTHSSVYKNIAHYRPDIDNDGGKIFTTLSSVSTTIRRE